MEYDVIVVGAGPCGTLLAHRLGQLGLTCLLLEKRGEEEAPGPSMAIGIMPPSLQILAELGLSETVEAAGCPVRLARVFEGRTECGTVDFGTLPPPFGHVLTLPQTRFVRLLRQALHARPGVEVQRSREVVAIEQDDTQVRVLIRDTATGAQARHTARFAAVCEGSRGGLRPLLGLPRSDRHYAVSFAMADFPDATGWPREARLTFSAGGAVESFPLPAARRRWIVQAPPAEASVEFLVERVAVATAVRLPPREAEWFSVFTPERGLCRRWHAGRVALCGDAAHVMSPIGGQGMNTGLADAWHLGATMQALCSGSVDLPHAWGAYEHARKRAFAAAANRAAGGMWLGTRRGAIASRLRGALLSRALRTPCLARRLPAHFAMLTLPQ